MTDRVLRARVICMCGVRRKNQQMKATLLRNEEAIARLIEMKTSR